MAIKHLSTTICEYLVPDPNGRNTLIRTYSNLEHRGPFPAVKMPFCFVIEVQGENDEFDIVIEGPGVHQHLGKSIAEKPPNLKPEQVWVTTLAVEMGPVAFPLPGIYAVAIYAKEQLIHRREFGVVPLATTEQQDGT